MATYPQKLGRYILERRLAAGGMAEVFLARQSGPEGFEKVCVVKRMLPHLTEDEVFVNMFLDEARLAARLTHPNIAQIFDFGRHDDAYYLAMEYVPGSNLHFVVDDHARRSSRMGVAAVVRVVALACTGLDFAHNALDESGQPLNIIHRDISPHNIMLSKTGDVKVIDFGIAKATIGLNLTKAGTLKGKYAYMAPEQVLGKVLDRRTDIYAMGLVLYELLAGRPAITGDSEASLMNAAAKREFKPIDQVRSDVPADVKRVLDRALAMNQGERYETAGLMADDLEDYLARSGIRVRPTDLGGLLSPSTSTTGVGPPPVGRVLATPSTLSLSDATSIEPTVQAKSQKQLPPVSDEEGTVTAKAVPSMQSDTHTAYEPAPPTAPMRAVVNAAPAAAVEPAPRRVLPAVLAVLLVVVATGATVFALTRAPNGDSEPVTGLLVPPPPLKPVVSPGQTDPQPVVDPVGKTPETVAKTPETVAKTPETVAKTPETVAKTPEKSPATVTKTPEKAPETVAKTPEKTPKTTKPTKPPKQGNTTTATPTAPAATAKGTVRFFVLPYGEVFRDGASLGTTPLKPLELDPGKYTFKFVNPETQKSDTREVTIAAGSTSTVKVDLR